MRWSFLLLFSLAIFCQAVLHVLLRFRLGEIFVELKLNSRRYTRIKIEDKFCGTSPDVEYFFKGKCVFISSRKDTHVEIEAREQLRQIHHQLWILREESSLQVQYFTQQLSGQSTATESQRRRFGPCKRTYSR